MDFTHDEALVLLHGLNIFRCEAEEQLHATPSSSADFQRLQELILNCDSAAEKLRKYNPSIF